MAMFACVTSNKHDLADELYADYMHSIDGNQRASQTLKPNDVITSDGGPDVTVSSLYLRSLLQQRKWEDGMKYLQEMESRTYQEGKPNELTYNMLLQHQVR